MKYTKEELEEFKRDPLMNFLAKILGTSMDEIVSTAEKDEKSRTEKNIEPKKKYEAPEAEVENDEIGKRIKRFFDNMVEDGKATATIEDGHPHYSIKMDNDYTEPESQEKLVEDDGTSFSMTKEELENFINDYRDADSTIRKIEHAYGIDLRENEKSPYYKYNEIIWNLIETIFGSDNREDIADYIFGDSNFYTVEDLYEELV